jgi:hypothetical protein
LINFTDNYFDLRLLKLSDIKLHEATETNRLRNIYNRISKSKYLMNPVIVGRYHDELILIDGANRYSSLKEIGCKLILAQLFDYNDPRLKLDKWNHLVYDFRLDKLIGFCDKNKLKYQLLSHNEGLRKQERKFNLLLASEIDDSRSILITLPGNFKMLLTLLTDITKLYFMQYRFDRSESDLDFNRIRKYSRNKGTLIVFPNLKKHHILRIANNDVKIPAGITRHIIFNRVLHVKYEIRKMMRENNIEKKQADLKNLLIDKIDKNKVRQYQESVIVFDE